MKLKLTKNRINSYLKKSSFDKDMERYEESEKRSVINFYADKDSEGINQNIKNLKGLDDIIFDRIEDTFNELSKNGYSNIRCEVFKNYYKQSKQCKPLMLQQSMLVYEYIYIN